MKSRSLWMSLVDPVKQTQSPAAGLQSMEPLAEAVADIGWTITEFHELIVPTAEAVPEAPLAPAEINTLSCHV